MTVLDGNKKLPELILRQGNLPEVLTDTDLGHLIQGSDDRRYSLIKRSLARGDLVQIRRGLYVLGDLYRRKTIHALELAQKIYGPSYISFESALSYWGLIPEAVHTVTSGSLARSQDFETPFGYFAYTRIPVRPLYAGVTRKIDDGATFLIAQPLRALADYVYASRKIWKVKDLAESLRIAELPGLEAEEFEAMSEWFRNHRVRIFLEDYRKMRHS